MERKRKFDFIKDTRFSDNPQGELNKMTTQLEKDISDKGILTVYPTRVLNFPDNVVSFRKTFIVEKRKGYKWDNLYGVINKIQAPHYEHI